MESSHRMTWVDPEGRTWRVERVAGRWQLSQYLPASETWQRLGSFPSKSEAVQRAYAAEQ
jgi:hypothetical protein